MKIKKQPSILEKTEFTSDGYVINKQGLLVPAYVASEEGFRKMLGEPGLEEFYKKLNLAGIFSLCPFQACSEYLGEMPNDEEPKSKHDEYWDRFNSLVGIVNYEFLMPRSKLLIAILEGAIINDGVATEIGYYHKKFQTNPLFPYNPIIGIRSDLRLSENPRAPINPAIRHLIDGEENEGEKSCGRFFCGTEAYDQAFVYLSQITSRMLDARGVKSN